MLRSLSIPVTEDGEVGADNKKQDSAQGSDREDGKVDKPYNLFIKAISWPSEGRGLLHVLSPLLYAKDYKIRAAHGSYFFVRDESQLSLIRSERDRDASQQVVCRLDVLKNSVLLDCSQYVPSCSQSEIWEEIPRESGGRLLSVESVLRFGSYKMKVADIVLSEEALRAGNAGSVAIKPFRDDLQDTQSEHTVAVSEAASATGPVCRICFEPAEEPNNALLSPCSCSGSLRYIHVGCLRRWLEGQLQVKQLDNGGGSYLIRTITCEICKSTYSKSVYGSILIPRPDKPHVILEDSVVPQLPVSPTSQFSQPIAKIHIVPIAKGRPVRIGRSKDNDIVLSDISVSRQHAELLLSDEGVRVVDLGSKFGSLVQLPPKIFHPISGVPLRVQIGSSLVELVAAFPSRIERMLPERFLQDRGVVKVLRSKSPNERIVEADRLRRTRSLSIPLSPAATINNSYVRSPAPEDERDVNRSS